MCDALSQCSQPLSTIRNRSRPFAADRSRTLRPLPLGEGSLARKRDVSDSCEIARKRVET